MESLQSVDYKNRLYNAIKGRGAFRRFKSTVHYLGIEQLWYEFRDNAYAEIAQKWCRNNDIEFA